MLAATRLLADAREPRAQRAHAASRLRAPALIERAGEIVDY